MSGRPSPAVRRNPLQPGEQGRVVPRPAGGQASAYPSCSRGCGASAIAPLLPAIGWREVAAMSLCLLTPEMHNRAIVDAAFRQAGALVQPAVETNSIVTVVLSVLDGEVCTVLPGALMVLVRGHKGLEALPLREPEVHTPIGFMVAKGARPSRALEAALALANDDAWLRLAGGEGDLPGV